MNASQSELVVRHLGQRAYTDTVEAMQSFTAARGPDTPDEIWLLEHPPVYTLGRAAAPEHVLAPGAIPVVHTDRGGQVTYHGPGQLVAYLLIDLQRRGVGIRPFVRLIEDSVVELLFGYGIEADTRPGAPGVYVGSRKIASLGLRVRRGCSYHGLSLNVAMDLAPFQGINPCGLPGLEVTQLSALAAVLEPDQALYTAAQGLVGILTRRLGYDKIQTAHSRPAIDVRSER